MPIWLLGMAAAALLFATDDYIIAGVLPELANSLEVSEAAAGQLITVYSLMIAVGAAPAAWLLRGRSPRVVICGALLAFTVVNAAAAAAPSYTVLFGLRVIAGAAAAVAVPSLLATTARLAPPDRRGRYLAIVGLGLTAAVAVGVPVGAVVASWWGWRGTFALMAGAGGVALAVLALWFPARPVPVAPEEDGGGVPAGRCTALVLALCASAVLIASEMLLLSYFAPYLGAVNDGGMLTRAALFALAGGAGVLGVWIGGLATDRWGHSLVLTVSVSCLLVVMGALSSLWLLRPVDVRLVAVVTTAWGLISFAALPAVHARLSHLAGPRLAVVAGVNTSLGYLGLAAAGAVGGLVLGHAGTQWLAPVSGAVAGVALLCHLGSVAAERIGRAGRRDESKREVGDAPTDDMSAGQPAWPDGRVADGRTLVSRREDS